MASISPICKKCKTFILALKSPTDRDFMIKKSLKSKTSKSHTWAPLRNQFRGIDGWGPKKFKNSASGFLSPHTMDEGSTG
jgi:hypothetical protein